MTIELIREALLLLAGLMMAAALAYWFARSAPVAMWTLAAIVVTSQAVVPAINLQVTVAGLTFYALDVVTGLMLAIGVVRLATQRIAPSVLVPMAALVAFFTIHVLWGVTQFGLQVAVNGSRIWLYLLGPVVFAALANPRCTSRSFLPLFVAAFVLASFGLFRVARYGLYAANTIIDINGQLVDARPVTAAGALLVVQCLVIALSGRFVWPAARWPVIALMVTTVVLLQHRTVWIVALVIGASGYVSWARTAIFANERAALGAASAILFLSPVAIALLASSSVFAQSARTATGQHSTLAWRTQSWTSLVEKHHSTQDFLVGLPAGTSLARRIDSQVAVATESPHSLYVDGFLSLGMFGPVMIAWLWMLIIGRRRMVATVLGLSGAAVVLIVVSNALFGITNSLGPLQGLLIGIFLQAAYPISRLIPETEK